MPDENEVIITDDGSDGSKEGTDQGTGDDKKEGLTDEQFAALKEDPRFQTMLQSEKDKAVATIEKRQRKSQQERLVDVRRQREDEELAGFVDSGDFESIGRRTAAAREKQKTLREAASMVSGEIEGTLAEHPEFRAIGEDKIEEIRQEVGAKGGSVVDFSIALSREARTRDLAGILEQSRQDNRKDMEAFLVEKGLAQRSTDDTTPSKDVVKGGGGGGSQKMTRAEAKVAYGEGRMTHEQAEKLGIV